MYASTPKILIVEDEITARTLLEEYLTQEGWQVETKDCAAGVLELLDKIDFDLIFLDRRLPDGDALTLCREIRAKSPIGIIFTTALTEDIEKVVGLENGADAYMCKPLAMRELVALSRNLISRVQSQKVAIKIQTSINQCQIYQFNNWSFDASRHKLESSTGKIETLTKSECLLLKNFVKNQGKFIERENLLKTSNEPSLKENDSSQNTRSIDVLVARLRQKLKTVSGNDESIVTQYGGGYMFTEIPKQVDEFST